MSFCRIAVDCFSVVLIDLFANLFTELCARVKRLVYAVYRLFMCFLFMKVFHGFTPVVHVFLVSMWGSPWYNGFVPSLVLSIEVRISIKEGGNKPYSGLSVLFVFCHIFTYPHYPHTKGSMDSYSQNKCQ